MPAITGYGIYKSSGGNKCIQCDTRMRKGLPYLSPQTGKKIKHEKKGKSICISCIKTIIDVVDKELKVCGDDELVKYENRRFVEHLK